MDNTNCSQSWDAAIIHVISYTCAFSASARQNVCCENGLRSCTLDVVIEGAVSVPVLVEDAKGVAVSEILKLNQAVHPVSSEG